MGSTELVLLPRKPRLRKRAGAESRSWPSAWDQREMKGPTADTVRCDQFFQRNHEGGFHGACD
jgi:hypothetical protein